MFKSFAAIALAGYTQAQTASNTSWTANTIAIQNDATTPVDVVNTKVAMQLSELANGANSYSVVNQQFTYTLTADAWPVFETPNTDAIAEIMECSPYTKTGTTPTTEYNCMLFTSMFGSYTTTTAPITMTWYTTN